MVDTLREACLSPEVHVPRLFLRCAGYGLDLPADVGTRRMDVVGRDHEGESAEGVEIDATWEELAREDIRNKWPDEPSDDDVAAWIAAFSRSCAKRQWLSIAAAVIPELDKSSSVGVLAHDDSGIRDNGVLFVLGASICRTGVATTLHSLVEENAATVNIQSVLNAGLFGGGPVPVR